MKIQVLCSTMYGVQPLFTKKGMLPNELVVVNQCLTEEHKVDGFKNYFETGLSKSRNRCIENASADICLLSDNDVYFDTETLNIVERSFVKYPEADILTFKVETPDGESFKNYKDEFFWHSKLSLAKVSSVEVAFRREAIVNKNIKFDENFGLGSKFATSEEYIFLSDALNCGLKIGFVPEVIVYHPKESSGGQFNKLSLVEAKGAMIKRVFGLYGIPICFIFSLKKFKHSEIGFLSFLKVIFKGFFSSN